MTRTLRKPRLEIPARTQAEIDSWKRLAHEANMPAATWARMMLNAIVEGEIKFESGAIKVNKETSREN